MKWRRCKNSHRHTAWSVQRIDLKDGLLTWQVTCECGVRGEWEVPVERIELLADSGYWEDTGDCGCSR